MTQMVQLAEPPSSHVFQIKVVAPPSVPPAARDSPTLPDAWTTSVTFLPKAELFCVRRLFMPSLVRLWLLPVSRSIGLPLLRSFSFLRFLSFILDVHSGVCIYPSRVKYLWISMDVHGQRGMGPRTSDPEPSRGWHPGIEHHREMGGLADDCVLKSSVGLHCCVWLRGAHFFE